VYKAGGAIKDEYNAEKGLSTAENVERSYKKGYEATGKVLAGAEKFLSGFKDVGKDIYQGTDWMFKTYGGASKLEELTKATIAETDPLKKRQLESLVEEQQKINAGVIEPEMMKKTNLQLGAQAGLATFNTMLTAVTLGTGTALVKGGEKIAGNFLQEAIESTLGKKILGPVAKEGMDLTTRQWIAHGLETVAKDKIFNGVAKIVGNKATAESAAIGAAYMAADVVKNGETDPNKIKDAAIDGLKFGWILDRGITGLIKGGSKLLGLDTQRNTLKDLVAETEAKLGRPLTEAEQQVAIKSFYQRVTPGGVADYMQKSDTETKDILNKAKTESANLLESPKTIPTEEITKGTGFTMKENASMEELGRAKAYENYQKELKKYNANPTVKQLEIVQKAKTTRDDLFLNEKIPESAPTETPAIQPEVQQKIVEKPVVTSQPPQEGGRIAEKVAVKQPEIIGGTKVSKVAKDVNATAIERHLTENGFDELAGYNPKVIKQESEKISKLLSTDTEKAVRMATGEAPVEGVHGQMLLNAVENAFKDDAEVMMKLAKSPIATERSLHAQALGLSRIGNVGGPAAKMKEVMEVREKNVSKKVGDIKQATSKITKEIEAEVKAIPHSKKTWSVFVESIKCK
jgi:hypothetical protein